MAEQVGFVGLGKMGRGIALNLLRRGFSLTVHDNRREAVDDLASHGAQPAENIAALAGSCNRIVLVLPDTSVVQSVLFGEEGLLAALRPGQVLIDCGTTHPTFTKETAVRLAWDGIVFLDAPVSGMRARAEAGTLTIMVGGEENAYRDVLPLLEAMGETIVYTGPSGSGQLAKTINNVLFNISCAAMAEMITTAAVLGLDPERMCQVVSASTGQSFGFDHFSRLALQRDFIPGYPMEHAHKDMLVMEEIAGSHHIPLPVASGAMRTYRMALERGLGGENKAAMVKVWESILGVEVRRPDEDAA